MNGAADHETHQMARALSCRTLTRIEVSTGSGSDRVAHRHSMLIAVPRSRPRDLGSVGALETRSLPLPVLTSSLVALRKAWEARNRNAAENRKKRKELDDVTRFGIFESREES